MPARRSRPASAQPARSRAPPAITVDFLRQRMTQMETTVRETQEELKRTLAQHEREIDALEHEHCGLRDKLDEVRMEECLTPDELAAARSDRGGAFKLVASSTPAYREAKTLVEEKRSECLKTEEELESLRAQLIQLRHDRAGAKRLRYASAVEAYMQTHQVNQSTMQVRDLIKVLETHIAQELDRLSDMTGDAKAIRTSIDAKLITQTRYEKNYARRVNELLERKKQMSFLTEVCQTLFDERALAVEELKRMQRIAQQEDKKYESAFDELSAVEDQNAQKQAENAARVQQLRQQLTAARQERLALEARNEKAKRDVAAGRLQTRRSTTRATPAGDNGDERESHDSADSQAPRHEPGSVEGRIAEFEDYLNQLSEIAGAETAQDVVNFIESSADDRFRCFSEIRTIEEEMQRLDAEKAKLVEAAGALGVPTSQEQEDRILRMREMQKQLTALKTESMDQEESAAESDLLVEKLVEQVGKMFTGLGCSVPALRSMTGSEIVSRATVEQALALVEQRIEEYLIAYSRRQQQQLSAAKSSTAAATHSGESGLFEAARPVVRRADLPAKVEGSSAECLVQAGKSLPYSGEVGDDTHAGATVAPEDRVLSNEEMRRIAQSRLRT